MDNGRGHREGPNAGGGQTKGWGKDREGEARGQRDAGNDIEGGGRCGGFEILTPLPQLFRSTALPRAVERGFSGSELASPNLLSLLYRPAFPPPRPHHDRCYRHPDRPLPIDRRHDSRRRPPPNDPRIYTPLHHLLLSPLISSPYQSKHQQQHQGQGGGGGGKMPALDAAAHCFHCYPDDITREGEG